VSAATWGAGRIAAYVGRRWQVRVAPSTVQRALRRAGLATRRQRLTVLEHHALQTAGLWTERTRQRLWRIRHGRTRHVEAREPGELDKCMRVPWIPPPGLATVLPACYHFTLHQEYPRTLRGIGLVAFRPAWMFLNWLSWGGGLFVISRSRVQLPPGAPHFPRATTLRQPRRLRWSPSGWQSRSIAWLRCEGYRCAWARP